MKWILQCNLRCQSLAYNRAFFRTRVLASGCRVSLPSVNRSWFRESRVWVTWWQCGQCAEFRFWILHDVTRVARLDVVPWIAMTFGFDRVVVRVPVPLLPDGEDLIYVVWHQICRPRATDLDSYSVSKLYNFAIQILFPLLDTRIGHLYCSRISLDLRLNIDRKFDTFFEISENVMKISNGYVTIVRELFSIIELYGNLV